MHALHVAIVSRSETLRDQAVAAFDSAPAAWRVSVHEELVPADVVVAGPDDAIDGALIFDPLNPAAIVSQVADLAPAKSIGGIHGVVGFGGGVGTTTLALHLAAAMGRTSVYLELDPRCGAAERLNVDRREVKTWAEIAAGSERATDIRLAAIPMPPGFRVLLAPHEVRDVSIADLATRVAGVFDRVVADIPSVLLPEFAGHLTTLVGVIGASGGGVRRAVEIVGAPDELPVALVLSRTGPGGTVTKLGCSEMLGREIAVELPLTPALRDAEDDGALLAGPWTRYTRRVAALARALEER